MHAEICPICNGKGTIPESYGEWISTGANEKVCHGCNGKGWVEVHDEHYCSLLQDYSFKFNGSI